MPKILDYEEFCKDLKEVTTTKLIRKRKFHENGLFSEQIFGPIRNYTCQCGVYHGISRAGSHCDKCNVDIVNSNERRKRFAKIVLPIKVVNPIFYDLLIDIGGSYIKDVLNKLMKNDKSVLYQDGEDFIVTVNPDNIPSGSQTWEKSDAIFKIIDVIATKYLNESDDWKLIKNNIDKLLIGNIIVLPPDLRPAAKNLAKNNQILDKINRYYMQILVKKETMTETIIDVRNNKELYYTYFKQLQKDVDELYKHILEKLSKKEGLIRGNILGKRIDFSGRGVIIPDPTLKLDECKLPYLLFIEIFKLPIAIKLIEIGKFKILNKSIDFIDECIKKKSFVLFNLCLQMAEGEYCILNRQPSLHRLSMLGFKIKLTMDDVIKIHPLVCQPFNADFDGDQMAVYIPISEETKQEVKEKILVTNNLFNPANNSLSTIPSQDIILGIYSITSEKFEILQEKVIYKNQIMTSGESIFNKCLPEDYKIILGEVNKNRLLDILNDITENYNKEITIEILDNIKKVGFKYSTLFGTTMSLDDCEIIQAKEIKEKLYENDNISEQLKKVSSNETTQIIKDNFKYSYMIESGARGSWDQVKQLVLSRGFISNFDGQIIPKPIKNSLIEGLTKEGFFNSTYGCRKGLLDVAINTGISGYLSRKLLLSCANLQLDPEFDDCKTTDLLSVYVTNILKAKMLIGKWMSHDNKLIKISKDNYKNIIGKTINIRSPIYCKNPKICSKCYGDLYKNLNSRFVGILAAQSLGERATQLILRTFHTCLRKDTKILDINGKSFTIEEIYKMVKNNEPFYTFSCSPIGELVTSKVINAFNDRIETKLIRITLDNDKYIECSHDHKFMLRNGEYYRAKNLENGDLLMPIYAGNGLSIYSANGGKIEFRSKHLNYLKTDYKIKKIEKIYLEKPENLYDLEVDSEYHNFPLASGIFVHNSGSAIIKKDDNKNIENKNNKSMKQQDIVGDLSSVSSMLHQFKDKTCDEIVSDLFKVYNKDIHHVHLECVVAQLMWVDYRKWRLLENRDSIIPEFVSIQSVPSRESWILGLAFSNPKKHILKGLLYSGHYSGILDKILLGEKMY